MAQSDLAGVWLQHHHDDRRRQLSLAKQIMIEVLCLICRSLFRNLVVLFPGITVLIVGVNQD